MSKGKIIVLILLLGIIALGVWYWRHIHTPEYVIRQKIEELCGHVRKAEEAGNISNVFNTMAFTNMMTETVEIGVEHLPFIHGKTSREELQSALANAKLHASTIIVTEKSLTVNYSKDTPDTATADGSFYVAVTLKQTSEVWDETFWVKISLKRIDDTWKFCAFETIQPLQK